MDKYTRPYEKKRIQIIKSLYQSIPFEKDWRAADIGAGIGFYADIIRPRVAEVVCLDISQSEVETCRAKGYNALCHNLNKGLPYKDSEFDFVNALEVIEHLENPIYFLKELKRIIKPHKYLLISTVNQLSPEGWKGKIAEIIKGGEWHGWDDTHKHLFSYPEVIDIINRHFEILNIIGYYFGVAIFKRHFPPFVWQFSSSNKILRSFGFNIVILAKNSKGSLNPERMKYKTA